MSNNRNPADENKAEAIAKFMNAAQDTQRRFLDGIATVYGSEKVKELQTDLKNILVNAKSDPDAPKAQIEKLEKAIIETAVYLSKPNAPSMTRPAPTKASSAPGKLEGNTDQQDNDKRHRFGR